MIEKGRKRLNWVAAGLLALTAAGCAAPPGQTPPPSEAPKTEETVPAAPEINPADFQSWLQGFRAEALQKGLKEETLDAALAGVQPIPRVLELDRKQPEFTLSFDDYVARVVSPARVQRGQAMVAANRDLLAAVSQRYGVPIQHIAAMWGIETDFGRVTGGFQIVPALATLAFDGRRSAYFRTELMNALTIADKGLAPPEKLKGSWAGAMGQCQFMPSTYLKYGQSWDGNGKPDIWDQPADVFASTANYLAGIGWKKDEIWGRAVKLPAGGIAPSLFGLDVSHSLTEWGKLGIVQNDGKPLEGEQMVSLIRAESGKNGDVGVGAPYVVGDNFRALMKWNRSTFFALAAGTLADRLASK
ncbi:MAG TPA: lytic murein transglycosylase [Candidatus Sulfotelmatobacter sp.]|jgi:membrane-bound lytic murein transglycosylase B|nr:lytic murein transglycosylase [Candidatus Sulfotelmatobacter sp.]